MLEIGKVEPLLVREAIKEVETPIRSRTVSAASRVEISILSLPDYLGEPTMEMVEVPTESTDMPNYPTGTSTDRTEYLCDSDPSYVSTSRGLNPKGLGSTACLTWPLYHILNIAKLDPWATCSRQSYTTNRH